MQVQSLQYTSPADCAPPELIFRNWSSTFWAITFSRPYRTTRLIRCIVKKVLATQQNDVFLCEHFRSRFLWKIPISPQLCIAVNCRNLSFPSLRLPLSQRQKWVQPLNTLGEHAYYQPVLYSCFWKRMNFVIFMIAASVAIRGLVTEVRLNKR